MTYIAPNLSALVGSSVAAQLIGAAGGVVSLSKIPACNIQVLSCAVSFFSSLLFLELCTLFFFFSFGLCRGWVDGCLLHCFVIPLGEQDTPLVCKTCADSLA